MITQGVAALGQFTQLDIIKKLQNFNTFTEDNDPHGEHDFGSFEVDGNRIFWKIDYYDRASFGTDDVGSEDPTDIEQTLRVLTVMLADEY